MDTFWRNDEHSWNFFDQAPLDPLEESVASGAAQIRNMERQISNTSFNFMDLEYISEFLDL